MLELFRQSLSRYIVIVNYDRCLRQSNVVQEYGLAAVLELNTVSLVIVIYYQTYHSTSSILNLVGILSKVANNILSNISYRYRASIEVRVVVINLNSTNQACDTLKS